MKEKGHKEMCILADMDILARDLRHQILQRLSNLEYPVTLQS